MRATSDILKNNQTATYQIEGEGSSLEEIKMEFFGDYWVDRSSESQTHCALDLDKIENTKLLFPEVQDEKVLESDVPNDSGSNPTSPSAKTKEKAW